jgi:hypothetical protein
VANRAGTADRAAHRGDDHGEGYVLPGVYRNWHRAHEGAQARFRGETDPRFDNPDGDYADAEAQRLERLAGSRVAAEAAAAEQIRREKPIRSKLLRPGWPLQPWWDPHRSFTIPRVPFFADDTLYDIGPNDVVTVNAERTARYRAEQAARRRSVVIATRAAEDRHTAGPVTGAELA